MTPAAQVANDMAARAAFWHGRDADVAGLCSQSARIIRLYLIGGRPDGRTVKGLLERLQRGAAQRHSPDLLGAIIRAKETIELLQAGGGE